MKNEWSGYLLRRPRKTRIVPASKARALAPDAGSISGKLGAASAAMPEPNPNNTIATILFICLSSESNITMSNQSYRTGSEPVKFINHKVAGARV